MSTATSAEVLARPSRTAVDVGLLCALISCAAFGSSGPFAKALIATGWTPAAIVLARIGIAGLVLLPAALYAVRGRFGQLRAQLPLLVAFGALAVAGAQLGYFNAVQRMPIGVALLLEYLGIVLVVLWVWMRSGRRPGATTLVGMALAIAGLVLVLDVLGGLTIDLVGAAWGVFAATGLAAYFIITAGSAERVPSVTLASLGMLVGALVLLALGLHRRDAPRDRDHVTSSSAVPTCRGGWPSRSCPWSPRPRHTCSAPSARAGWGPRSRPSSGSPRCSSRCCSRGCCSASCRFRSSWRAER